MNFHPYFQAIIFLFFLNFLFTLHTSHSSSASPLPPPTRLLPIHYSERVKPPIGSQQSLAASVEARIRSFPLHRGWPGITALIGKHTGTTDLNSWELTDSILRDWESAWDWTRSSACWPQLCSLAWAFCGIPCSGTRIYIWCMSWLFQFSNFLHNSSFESG